MWAGNDQHLSPAERSAIHRWLEAFENAVRTRNFAAGRALCADQIVSFCTVVPRADGLDELESAQWQLVWPATEGFAFDRDSLHCGGQGGAYWAMVAWSSRGHESSHAPVERRGRATIILRTVPAGLHAIHTHFSLVPAAPFPRGPGGKP